jgi:putative endonuclease
MKRQQTGKLAERLAREYLEQAGYVILEANWRCPGAEIDIICQKDAETVFVEVRAKSSGEFGTPAESITRHKRGKLIAAAEQYLSERPDSPPDWRIDFIGIEFSSGGHHLEHIPHAVTGDP